MNLFLITVLLAAVLTLLLIGAILIRIVGQNTEVIVETFGKYSKTLTAGLNIIWWPVQTLVASYSLAVQTLNEDVSIKTKDSQFINLPVTVLYSISDTFKAHYKLAGASNVIGTLVLNSIRPIASTMNLDELFADRSSLKTQVKDALDYLLADYGFSLQDVLIDQPKLTKEAQTAFNAVLLADKHRQASIAQAEANRITIEAQAKAEAESQRLRARGLADSRKILADSLKESLDNLGALGAQRAVEVLLETNRIDALRTMAKESSNLIILDTTKQTPVIVDGKST